MQYVAALWRALGSPSSEQQKRRAAAAPSPLLALPPELLQHCFSFLGEEDRQAVLDVCRSWHATLVAAPELVPTVRLSCVHDEGDAAALRACSSRTFWGFPRRALKTCPKLQAALGRLPTLSPRTLRVSLDCFDWCLLLPDGITALELSSYCTDDVPEALASLSQLQLLALTGNSREVDWAEPSAQALVSKLSELKLLYGGRRPAHVQFPRGVNKLTLPERNAAALAAASRLERLELQFERWSSSIEQLCQALPALRDLSLDLRPDVDSEDATPSSDLRQDLPAMVAALRRLTRPTAVRLCVGSMIYPDWGNPGEATPVQLPPLAGLSALTEIDLVLLALPPPDWRQLSSLRRLMVEECWDGVAGGSAEPLTGLSSLTHLAACTHAVPEPGLLAGLPRLASVQMKGATAEWRRQLADQLPHITFIEPLLS